MRLDLARRILADSRCRVTEAALATGFANMAHFSRAYQARFGERPSRTGERGTNLPGLLCGQPGGLHS